MKFVKIDSIETENYDGSVYNLKTDTHEYIAEDVVEKKGEYGDLWGIW